MVTHNLISANWAIGLTNLNIRMSLNNTTVIYVNKFGQFRRHYSYGIELNRLITTSEYAIREVGEPGQVTSET